MRSWLGGRRSDLPSDTCERSIVVELDLAAANADAQVGEQDLEGPWSQELDFISA